TGEEAAASSIPPLLVWGQENDHREGSLRLARNLLLTEYSGSRAILFAEMPASRRARRLRWLAPVAVAAAIGLLALVPTLSSAATPDLPGITPEQLVAKVKQSNVQAFSGTFQLTTDLGIPNLSSLQGAGGQGGA